MRTIKLVIAYDGTDYAGWQRQKGQLTVQEVIERKLAILTSESIILQGAGRTDAGVHALGMAASFRTASTMSAIAFQNGLNSLLPPDIRVREAIIEKDDFHARYSAVAKAYRYFLTFGEIQIPTDRLYAHHLRSPISVQQVVSCLQLIKGTHDFASFEASGSRDKSKEEGRGAVRTLYAANYFPGIHPNRSGEFVFVGDGFLRHMVRNLVGTLIEVGRGKKTVTDFDEIMKARDRKCAGQTAPSNGLFLQDVFFSSEECDAFCVSVTEKKGFFNE